jgi:hypothetical protein
MEILYTVQNPHVSPNAVRVNVRGQDMAATVDMYEVELVAEDLSNGGIKLRFCGSDVDAAKELFKADAKVKVTFAAADYVAPEQPAPGGGG